MTLPAPLRLAVFLALAAVALAFAALVQTLALVGRAEVLRFAGLVLRAAAGSPSVAMLVVGAVCSALWAFSAGRIGRPA